MTFLLSVLEQALIFAPLVLGMYISYQILNITDLTVDGTFVLGAVIFAKTVDHGIFFAVIASLLVGAIIGFIISCLQKSNNINPLLVGILGTFMLYSINLQIAGRPNINLLNKPTILGICGIDNWLVILFIINICLVWGLVTLLQSNLGLKLRAFGYNRKLLYILGSNAERYRSLGLVISNSFAALSGCLAAQVNGFADINMGIGVALVSIGAIIIGRQLLIVKSQFLATRDVLSCILGIVAYFVCLNILLRIGIDPVNLKFILGIIIFISLNKLPQKRF